MERRKAVIAAATASLSLLAGGAAIGLSTGIVGASGNDGAGQISPVVTSADVVTLTVDDPASSGEGLDGSSTDRFADDLYEHDDDRYIDDHGGNAEVEHEYEGADDDD